MLISYKELRILSQRAVQCRDTCTALVCVWWTCLCLFRLMKWDYDLCRIPSKCHYCSNLTWVSVLGTGLEAVILYIFFLIFYSLYFCKVWPTEDENPYGNLALRAEIGWQFLISV